MADNTRPSVFTAALAVIKINNSPVGLMRNLRCQEQYQRGEVRGIGVINPSEAPVLSFTASFQASAMLIDLHKFGTASSNFLGRSARSAQALLSTLLMNETPISLDLFRKVPSKIDGQDPPAGGVVGGIVTGVKEERFGSIAAIYLNSQSFDVSENQISGTDISGIYLEPMILSVNPPTVSSGFTPATQDIKPGTELTASGAIGV